jgi:quercetin dioxygenase-like cupin family protein
MIERAGTASFDHTLHGGALPTRVQWHFREETSLPVSVQTWELPPGGSEGTHVHPVGDEALEELYVLHEGHAAMSLDGVDHELRPGDAVLARAGVPHDLRNIGDETVRVTIIWGRPGVPVDWTRFASGQKSEAARRSGTAD